MLYGHHTQTMAPLRPTVQQRVHEVQLKWMDRHLSPHQTRDEMPFLLDLSDKDKTVQV